MNRWVSGCLLLMAAGALWLRLPQLDRRPMHTDESVHTYKFKGLLEQGVYRYDPNEYHGPSLYYFTLPVVKLSSARTYAQTTETQYRLVTVLFGVGSLLLLGLFADALGRSALVWAGLFTAISPAMVFYSRYYIHEMLLIFFTALVIGSGWRYSRTRHPGWALLTGAGLGLMHATKETFVFSLVAMVVAIGATVVMSPKAARVPGTPRFIPAKHWLPALGVACLVSVLFFSSFFSYPTGILDSVRTYLPWLNRAQGQSPHVHPWYYYLSLLTFTHNGRGPVFSELLIIVLALAGLVAALAGKGLGFVSVPFGRFIGIYTVVLTVIYSLIPYKTPWCLLGFWQGMIILAGIGAAVLVNLCRQRAAQVGVGVLLAAGANHLAWQAFEASYPLCADQRNPYVYAHTAPDLLNLVGELERLAQVHVKGHGMTVKVMAANGDYWPLPWYLRRFTHVGFFPNVPPEPAGDALVISPAFAPELEAKLGKAVAMCGFFSHRPSVFLELFVESTFWTDYLKHRPPEPD